VEVVTVAVSHLNMVLDQVDANDRVIGVIRRRDVFARSANFRVVHVIVTNRNGELLLQKIPEGRRHAGMWGSSVAGYFRKGETRAEAAKRKLGEELRIEAAGLRWIGKTRMVDEGSMKFIYVAAVRHDGAVRLDPEHASGLEFISPEALAQMREHRARPFTATFLHVLDFYLGHAHR
jgi:isopentenyldiphosphate isomerase